MSHVHDHHGCPQDGWNRLDAVLVAVAIVDVAAESFHVTFLRVLRALRMHRMLRILRTTQPKPLARLAADIRMLVTTWVAAIPAFGNVAALIGLMLFMYAYIGVYVFGRLRWNLGAWCASPPSLSANVLCMCIQDSCTRHLMHTRSFCCLCRHQ